jgi:O-antigen/teichoic acid export membrane protein
LFFQVYSIDTIVIIEIFAYLIPFLINFIIFVITLLKIKPTKEEKLSYKETIKQIVSYGSITSTQSVLGQVWKETEVQAVGAFESAAVVTGFNTGNHYGDIPRLFSNSLKNPLMISFTSLYSKGELEKINKIVKIITIYSLFIILIVSGIVFLLTDFYLALVLGESFLIYSDLIKLIIISIIFGIEFSILTLLLRSSDKVRFLPLTLVIYYAIRISGFFIGLIFFGIVGAIIGLTIGNAISFVLSYLLIRKMFKITTNLFKIISLYISFAFSLIVAIVLGDLFFNSITFSLLESLNLSFFKYVPFFELLIFFFLDMGLIIIFKSLTKRDIEYVLSIFTKDKLTHKVIRKWLNTLKKIFR